MKLRSGRKYKNDLSDIIGILYEHEKRGNPLMLEDIDKAVSNLYGGWETIPADSTSFIKDTMKKAIWKKPIKLYAMKKNVQKICLFSLRLTIPV